jgi:hypothetical protein
MWCDRFVVTAVTSVTAVTGVTAVTITQQNTFVIVTASDRFSPLVTSPVTSHFPF